MSVDVLLLTNQDDFESALPTLKSVAQTTRRAPLFVDGDQDIADVAIIDARTDLEAAQRACRRLTANAPAIAVVAVVAPADFAAVDVDWCFDDVLLPAAGEDELHTRLRLAITRRRSALACTLKFGDLVLHQASFTGSAGGKDLGLTLTVILIDNAGFGCIHRLQAAVGADAFNNRLADAYPETRVPVDFVAHARALGAKAELASTLDDFEAA